MPPLIFGNLADEQYSGGTFRIPNRVWAQNGRAFFGGLEGCANTWLMRIIMPH
jgi:hypothetical protein